MNTNYRKLKFSLCAGVALAAASLSAHATQVAPYFYTWAFGGSGYAANSLAQAKAAGVNAVTLAFGTSNGSCTLQGFDVFNQSTYKTDLQNYISGGGKVILSFGGADGPFLEDDCSTSAFYNIVNNLVSTYNIYGLDFDVEGSEVDDTSAANVRNAAIAQLQAAHPNLYVSFTVPVDPSGLPGDVLTLIKNAKNAGVNISVVNIMTMDYGNQGQDEGSWAIESANGTFNQLKSVYTNLSTAQLWGMIGITPMIGNNDYPGNNEPSNPETFTIADATSVTQFAETNNIGLISYWALNRDQPGAAPTEDSLDQFNGVSTSKFQYYNIFAAAESSSSSPPPVNGTFPVGTYTIEDDFSGLCVDVTSRSTSAGALIQQYACNGTSAQTFQVVSEGSGWYKIVNTNSQLPIDVEGDSSTNGTAIDQYTDNGTEAQRFAITVTDSSDPTAFSIMNEHSGSCLDDTNWSTTAINLQLWSCTGATNQSFRFYPIGSTTPVSVE
jgi:chitinase